MRDIERYLNVRGAGGASLSPGGTLAFLLDTTGTSQVWTLDEPEAWPEQRTFFEDRVTFCTFSPEREELAFGSDEGGDERQQLYRLDDDGRITNWTQRPDAKHWWGGWSSDGERFAFTSNRRDESVFDVYVQDRDATGDDARLVHEGDGWLSVSGWSPDDATLALHVAHHSFDHDVYALDVETGERTHLTPHEAETRYSSLSWGPDGGLYCVTDEGADTLSLARLGLDGTLETVETGGEWNLDGVALDEDSGRFVYSRNVDGYTELTVGDLTGPTSYERLGEPALPKGTAGGVSFSDDADRFALTVSADTQNANVHLVDVDAVEGAESVTGDGAQSDTGDGGESHTGDGDEADPYVTGDDAERWTRASTAGIDPDSFRPSELVRYETFDGREIPAYFALPETTSGGGTPVIVDVHGGPASQRRPSFSALKQYFLANGYAFFEPNVRGSTGYGREYTHLDDVEKRMDSVRDLEAAHDWLADHPAVDPDRIAVKGGSYGGFMVLAALTEYPDLWAAGVDVVGIANFVTFLENTGSWRRELREAEYGSLAEDRELLRSISPVHRADRIRAPLFVVHGANDPRVPVGEAEQIAAEAGEHVPVETLIFEDEGHGIVKRENRIEAYTRMVDFLDEHL